MGDQTYRLLSRAEAGLSPSECGWQLRTLSVDGKERVLHDVIDWEVTNPPFGRVFSTIHAEVGADGSVRHMWDQYAINEGPPLAADREPVWGVPAKRMPSAICVPYVGKPLRGETDEPHVAFVRRQRPHVTVPPGRAGRDFCLEFQELPRGFANPEDAGTWETAVRETAEEVGLDPQFPGFDDQFTTRGPRFLGYVNANTAFFCSNIAVFAAELDLERPDIDLGQFGVDEVEDRLLKGPNEILLPSAWWRRQRGHIACSLTAAALFLFLQEWRGFSQGSDD